jgi:hypothetical protein
VRFGDREADGGSSVALDASGNLYVAGSVEGEFDVAGILEGPVGSRRGVLMSFDSGGTLRWSRELPGARADHLAVAGGRLYAFGTYAPGADIGGGTMTSAGSTNTFLAELDPADGSHLWSRTCAHDDSFSANGLGVDGAGNLYVAAGASNAVDYGGGVLTPVGSGDIVLASYTADGVYRYATLFGSANHDLVEGFDADDAGNAFLVGKWSSDNGSIGVFVASYDSGGTERWRTDLNRVDNGTSGQDFGLAVAPDGDPLYVAGWVKSPIDFGGGLETPVSNDNDAFVVSYDPADGSYRWGGLLGSVLWDELVAVSIGPSEEAYVTGTVAAAVDVGATRVWSHGVKDVLLARYEPNGAVTWAQAIGGPGMQGGNAVAVHSDGTLYLSATTRTRADMAGLLFSGRYHSTDGLILRLDPIP